MPHPLEIFYHHRDQVRAAGTGGPSKAWKTLEGTCPEISRSMSLNTFRIHFPGFLALMALIEADRPTQEAPEEAPETPRAYQGWTVNTDKRGFVRLYKSVKGKTVCRYIGKTWNPEKADELIDKAEVLFFKGECFMAAFYAASDYHDEDPIICHGYYAKNGEGLYLGHAWVELGEKVFDYTVSKKPIPAEDYFRERIFYPPSVVKYTLRDFAIRMTDSGNYGPFHTGPVLGNVERLERLKQVFG